MFVDRDWAMSGHEAQSNGVGKPIRTPQNDGGGLSKPSNLVYLCTNESNE